MSEVQKIDNERIEQILKGRFIFGFSGSDLFILLAAFLTLIFLQLQPYVIPYLEGKPMGTQALIETGENPAAQASMSAEPKLATPSADESGQKPATQSGKQEEGNQGNRVYCKLQRPQICTQECIASPPYICGSDGKNHCSACQACADPQVEWYMIEDQPCPDITPGL
ncbi:MAG: hypothetical protein A2785_03595 [Candidatus Chisholmbacteria bacterium RIFCSPHIGHO2_01_FULL_49_18]|uniref:Kazal-like domain-containing protein n=2 Tax=Candidatus Chisholmiibacteriota TaxID=1817900 RepID=A0A1G1VN88_9BACT|nr:MAG: hypothetical protein A2785_03595 [Candidatus Chisholmbacteria bacterium RIFCSPHIGHO2_01_FULL_49_18]OGY19484.1 MAG: hypothetical protein A3A65_06265 [Candidatus Chisholmbacteria bacterium RIFCSPLOWO2_01_FULL_49_14]